ncbi:MAG: sulfur carrier protein ThiS [Thermoanaerobaculia bacterium]|nr:sulfur carrier protein ThiS [Thermoanaerobaculia bacterium]
MTTVRVNGEANCTEASNLAALLKERELDPRTVAVEHNGAVIPRDRYTETPLAEGDQIEIVRFVQGG